MDNPNDLRTNSEAQGTVWPPAPTMATTRSVPAHFHLVTGGGYLIAQKSNILAALLVAGTGLWNVVALSNAATIAFGLAAVFDSLSLIAAGLLFLIYIYHSYRSVRELGASGLPYTNGWAVGWFFVPFMNIYMPLRIAQMIWRASDVSPEPGHEFAWQGNRNSPLINFWWGAYLFWNLSSTLGNLASKSEPATSDHTLGLYAGNALLGIVPSVLAILMVGAIRKRQEQTAKNLGLEITTGPQPKAY